VHGVGWGIRGSKDTDTNGSIFARGGGEEVMSTIDR
jgi:hypothetical protein